MSAIAGAPPSRHFLRFDGNPGNPFQHPRDVFSPFITHAVIPGIDTVYHGIFPRHIQIDRGSNKQTFTFDRNHQNGWPTKLHVKIVVVTGVVVHGIVVGNQRNFDAGCAELRPELLQILFEHGYITYISNGTLHYEQIYLIYQNPA